MKYNMLILFLLCILLSSFTPGEDKGNSSSCVGIWDTPGGKSKVEIYKAVNGKYYGKIVWLKVSTYKDGTPLRDKNNPDSKLRERPILGLLLLRDFKSAGKNEWESGKIYDPEGGKDYSCKMTLTDPHTLEVRGYVGISLIGRTSIWTR